MKKQSVLWVVAVVTVGCSAGRAPEAAPAQDTALAQDTAPTQDIAPSGQAASDTGPPPAAPAESEAQQSPRSSHDQAAPHEEKRKSAFGPEPLQVEIDSFDDALEPRQLSCEGARPHRDAICAIAERLCELPAERPSTIRPSASCEGARQSCDAAKTKFKSRCG